MTIRALEALVWHLLCDDRKIVGEVAAYNCLADAYHKGRIDALEYVHQNIQKVIAGANAEPTCQSK